MINQILYLGPRGSYSEIAAHKFSNYCSTDCALCVKDSIHGIAEELEKESSSDVAAVLPIENSLEGVVRETQDKLPQLAKIDYRITAETQLTIEHALIGYGRKSEIKILSSHPQALAQCKNYIYKNWSDKVELIPSLSTSAAIKRLSRDNVQLAAIGNVYCAELHNTPIIEKNINDQPNNTTRFIFLSKIIPENIKDNKVSIVFSTENTPGALNKVLSIFEKHQLNLSYISSRPSGRQLGEYIFYADFAGHTDDSTVVSALLEIKPYIKTMEILSNGATHV